MADTVKPGHKTTEFWLTLVATIAGSATMLIEPSEGCSGDRWILRVAGLVASTLAVMGYTHARGAAKKG